MTSIVVLSPAEKDTRTIVFGVNQALERLQSGAGLSSTSIVAGDGSVTVTSSTTTTIKVNVANVNSWTGLQAFATASVGTTSPNVNFPLDVDGLMRAYNGGNDAGVYIGSLTAGQASIQGINAANNAVKPIHFQPSGGAAYFTGNGVGIGTTSPSTVLPYALDVRGYCAFGSTVADAFVFLGAPTSGQAAIQGISSATNVVKPLYLQGSGGGDIFTPHNGGVYIGGGTPWYDVTTFGADPTNVSDSTTSIQDAINAAATNFRAGGFVFFPAGSYKVTSTIFVKGSTYLIGSGRNISAINGSTSDFNVLVWGSTGNNNWSGMQDMAVYGRFDFSAAFNTVRIEYPNIHTSFTRCNLLGGYSALYNLGVDGLFSDCTFCGFTTHLTINGASNYLRCQIDDGVFNLTTTSTVPNNAATALQLGSYPLNSAAQENSFVMCDFSSSGFTIRSVTISSTNGPTMTKFTDCVFSAPVYSAATWSAFTNCEFGAAGGTIVGSTSTDQQGYISVVASYGTNGAVTVSAANKYIAGCPNIS